MRKEKHYIWEKEEYTYGFAFGFVPSVMAYLHEDGKRHSAVLIAPGGGYCAVSPGEGELVALKFYEMGYQAFVLTYTTNLLMTVPLKRQPLQDISRAVRYIRNRSLEFGVEKNRLALCGFSAGGHLCASLCVHNRDIEDIDNKYNCISNRPDAAILCYPVITSGKFAHKESFTALLGQDACKEEINYMSLEKHVTEEMPPCFVWTTATDDLVPPENSEMFVGACREKGIPCAFHMFSSGKHGLSLADDVWANGEHMEPYTLEQIQCLTEQAENGTIQLPKEVKELFQGNGATLWGNSHEIPNWEVAVWPELAARFLERIF